MRTFLKVLNGRQAAAIEHIVLAHPGLEYNACLASTVQCRLKSLKTLVCFRNIFCNERGEALFGLETRTREARSLQAFRAVSSRGVVLIVMFRSEFPSEMRPNVSSELLRSVSQWASSIERDLSKPLLEDVLDTCEAKSLAPERREHQTTEDPPWRSQRP